MPKRVLIADRLSEAGTAVLQECCEVDVRPSITTDELLEIIPQYDALVVRSATQVSAEVLARGSRLKVVGRAGTGVDNIDIGSATREGILVVNAPTSNTIAVAEHTLALMLCLARNIVPADRSVHAGRWERSRFLGSELRNKTLGLVGLGRVGTAVATRARAFEMRVLACDPFVAPERAARLDVSLVDLQDLLAQSDYVSLHAPSNEATRGLIGRRELALLKPTACLINCARGDLIVEDALVEALEQGSIAGAALDVYPDEPEVSEALRRCERVVLTPHLGASTREAQDAAAVDVARQVVDVLSGRPARYPVNVTPLPEEQRALMEPYMDLADRLGRFYAQMTQDNIQRVEVVYGGEMTGFSTEVLTDAVLAGLLADISEDPVNVVNARLIARERGISVVETRTDESADLTQLLTVRAESTAGTMEIAGTVMRGRPHVVRLGGFWFDFVAEGILLVSEHREQPGVIGQMGTLLGRHGISISFVQVGRQERGGHGLMVLGLDDALTEEVMVDMMTLPSIRSARVVRL